MTISFDAVRDDLEWDGSLRDIYVLGTTSTDWHRVLEAIHRAPLETQFRIAGDVADLFADGREALPEDGFQDRFLQVRVGGVALNCHCFAPEAIEFDLDPREVTSQSALDCVIASWCCSQTPAENRRC
ncbi:MAG: hypothetical protein HOW73_22660 [Polyangiaceae bacterium]|nr:hypothetical protein [Polyangiaceae bacterium]